MVAKSKLAELCRREAGLSAVQTEYLVGIAPCLPFAADLTGGEVALYVPAKGSGEYIGIWRSEKAKGEIGGTLTRKYLLEETFRTGKSLNQWEETEDGGIGVRSFPLKDSRRNTLAVVILAFASQMPMSEYAHILHGTATLLAQAAKFNPAIFAPLTVADGILLADAFHRIVYADEIARLIYRSFGISSPVGRLLGDELTKNADREVRSKKTPWQRELFVAERVIVERRLDFAEGGSSMGHILVLSDVTEKRRRDEEAKVQDALMRRIGELEEELTGVKASLETRKLLDRAKGILMAEFKISEEESYRRIQRYAMAKRMTIKDAASLILTKRNG